MVVRRTVPIRAGRVRLRGCPRRTIIGGVSVVAEIEEALVAHWSHFGRWPRGALHDRDGLLWFETPITHLPYNGVVRSCPHERPSADAAIRALIERFRARGVQCFWVVHPSASPADLAERLSAHELRPVERMTGMSLDLAGWNASPLPDSVVVEEVLDDAGMEAYTDLTMRYWEIPDDEQELVREVHRHWGPGRAPGHRYVAFADGEAVAKAYLSLAGPARVASIYGMSVLPRARGRGVARAMTTTLLQRAKELDCVRVVLHSTDMAVGVYARAGFVEHCRFTVYATAALWSDEH
jgi:ribosomal protein S18 acetylase RimI-like enzyme